VKRSIAAVAVVGALAACREPDQRALGPALDGVNALGFYAFTGMLGAIATNGIPDIAAAPFAIARTPLPERILPTGAAIPGIAPPSVVAYIDRLGAPAAFDVAAAPAAGTVTLGGDELAIEVTDAIVDGFPLARDQVTACSVKGLDVHGAAVLDLDLDGADLNEVALVGVSLAGRADVASGVWVTGVSASSIRCTCAAGSGVELSACIPASAPYDLTVRVRLHVAVSEVNTDGTATATPLCESGVPVTQAGCTAAAGTFVNGACLVGDRDRDGIDGYVADGITVDSLAQHLRASAASAVKVAFDRKVVATLSCGARSYDFTGEIGVAGLFGGKRWIAGGGDPIVVEQERWHTATLMSLVNAFGQRVNVSLRHPSLGPTTFGSGAPRPPELRPFQAELDLDGDGAAEDLRAEFDKTDGTYYGNVFTGDCATSSHPDCQSPGVFNAVAFVRIADTDQQFIAVIADGISEGECAQRFAE
jgi:hypothetical protein